MENMPCDGCQDLEKKKSNLTHPASLLYIYALIRLTSEAGGFIEQLRVLTYKETAVRTSFIIT